jgi:hypothetical protein
MPSGRRIRALCGRVGWVFIRRIWAYRIWAYRIWAYRIWAYRIWAYRIWAYRIWADRIWAYRIWAHAVTAHDALTGSRLRCAPAALSTSRQKAQSCAAVVGAPHF